MIEKTEITVPNFRPVFSTKKDVVVCRTQAGFKKALKKFSGKGDYEVYGYPKVYPCLVVFNICYRGYEFIQCSTIPMNKLRDIVEQDKLDSINLLKGKS